MSKAEHGNEITTFNSHFKVTLCLRDRTLHWAVERYHWEDNLVLPLELSGGEEEVTKLLIL